MSSTMLFSAPRRLEPLSPGAAAALDLALGAPRDEGTWRALADLLESEGDPRGEWMQLELDAEAGTLRGLARGRRVALQQELFARLRPPGLSLEGAVAWRGLILGAVLGATPPSALEDPRWSTLRWLGFSPAVDVGSSWDWLRSPLLGVQLRCLVGLIDLPVEALRDLEHASLPRLELLRLRWERGEFAGGAWAALWSALAPRFPRLAQLHLGQPGSGPAAAARLGPVVAARLARVSVVAEVGELPWFVDWHRASGASWSLGLELWDLPGLPARVEVTAEGLVVTSEDSHHALRAKERVRSQFAAEAPPTVARVEAPPSPRPG